MGTHFPAAGILTNFDVVYSKNVKRFVYMSSAQGHEDIFHVYTKVCQPYIADISARAIIVLLLE